MEILKQGRQQLLEAVSFTKDQPGAEYMDLHGRKLVDAAIMLIVGHLFLRQCIDQPHFQDDFTDIPDQNNDTQNTDNNHQNTSSYRTVQQHKRILTRRYINSNAAKIDLLTRQVIRRDRSTMTDYDILVGPVPVL